eukprot:Rmarinus@m.12305
MNDIREDATPEELFRILSPQWFVEKSDEDASIATVNWLYATKQYEDCVGFVTGLFGRTEELRLNSVALRALLDTRARCYYALSRFEECEADTREMFHRWFSYFKEHSLLFYRLGACAVHLGDTGAALAYHYRYTHIRSRHPEPWLCLGTSLLMLVRSGCGAAPSLQWTDASGGVLACRSKEDRMAHSGCLFCELRVETVCFVTLAAATLCMERCRDICARRLRQVDAPSALSDELYARLLEQAAGNLTALERHTCSRIELDTECALNEKITGVVRAERDARIGMIRDRLPWFLELWEKCIPTSQPSNIDVGEVSKNSEGLASGF